MVEHLSSRHDRRPRLIYSRKQFDDYWIALLAKIRANDDAERLVSGLALHPLVDFQRANNDALTALGILPFPSRQLLEDPVDTFQFFSNSVTNNMM